MRKKRERKKILNNESLNTYISLFNIGGIEHEYE